MGFMTVVAAVGGDDVMSNRNLYNHHQSEQQYRSHRQMNRHKPDQVGTFHNLEHLLSFFQFLEIRQLRQCVKVFDIF